MARTRRSVGSVRKKSNGRWYAEMTAPSDEGSGSRRVALGGHPTKGQAERAVAQAVVALEKGELVRADRQALGRYLVDVWLPSIEGEIRPTTLANYRAISRCYVLPHSIARKRLDALHELDFKQLYATLRREGGRTLSGLSPKTVLHVHVMLRRALQDAVASRLIARNPAPRKRPRVEKREQLWLGAEQLDALLAVARFRDPDLYPAFRLAALAGLRRAEIAGLRWLDVDLSAKTVSLTRTRTVAGGVVVTGPTKTRTSSTTMGIDAGTAHALLRLRDRRAAVIEDEVPPTEHIFVRASGEPIHPELFTERLRAVVATANAERSETLPNISLHGLRHSYASALLASGEHLNDINYPACSAFEYEYSAGFASHTNCYDIQAEAQREYGLTPDDVHDPFNVWLESGVDEHGMLFSRPCSARPGDFVELLAHIDTLAVTNVCGDDLFGSSQFEMKPVKLKVSAASVEQRSSWLLPEERTYVNQRTPKDFKQATIKATRELVPDLDYVPEWPATPLHQSEYLVRLPSDAAGWIEALRKTGRFGRTDGEIVRAVLFHWWQETNAAGSDRDARGGA